MFLLFLLYLISFALSFTLGEKYFTENLVIILKDISNDLAVGDMVIIFLDTESPDKPTFATSIITLFFLDLTVGLLKVRQPLCHLLGFEGSAKNINASSSHHFEPDSGIVLVIHLSTINISILHQTILLMEQQNMLSDKQNLPDFITSSLPPQLLQTDLKGLQAEQHCLHRLKSQREGVEELSSLCQTQKQHIQKLNSTISALEQKLQQANSLEDYRQAYQQLKVQYEDLYSQNDIQIFEHQEIIESLRAQLLRWESDKVQSKQTERNLMEQIGIIDQRWRQTLEDKEEALTKLQRQSSRREEDLLWQLKAVKDKFKDLEHEYNSMECQRKSIQKSKHQGEKAKELQLQRVRRKLSKRQGECSRVRLSSSVKQNQWQLQRQDWRRNVGQLQMIVKSLRRELTQRIIQNDKLRQAMTTMTNNHERLADRTDFLTKQQKVSKGKNSRERVCEVKVRTGLEDQIVRLRRQNLKNVDEYNLLQLQLKKWMSLAQRKQQQLRLRI